MQEKDFEHIEQFFNKQLKPEAVQAFEQKIADDTAFAAEVAEYAKTKYALQKHTDTERAQRFETIYKVKNNIPIAGEYHGKVIKPKYWLAAASVLLVCFLAYRFWAEPNYSQMADNYIQENFTNLSSTMAAGGSDIQKGIGLYNEGKYTEALLIFEAQAKNNNTDAVKYAGITYLKLKQYNQAIAYFTQLEKTPLQSNPGHFYHALALIQSGNIEAAKPIIEKIKEEKLEGWENF